MKKTRLSRFYNEMKYHQFDVDLEIDYLEKAIQSIYQYIIANEQQDCMNIIKKNNEKIKQIIEEDILFVTRTSRCKHDGELIMESKDDNVWYVCKTCNAIVE